MVLFWFAQTTPGADAGSLWGLAGVVVMVVGGVVTTLLVQRRRSNHEDPVTTALQSIITDLRHEMTLQQERCDREITEIRDRHDRELKRLRAMIARLEEQRP